MEPSASQPKIEHGINPREPEIISGEDQILNAYTQLNLDEYLTIYALDSNKPRVSEAVGHIIEGFLTEYGETIAHIAENNGGIQNTALIRLAFERLYDGMDRAATIKLGPEPPHSMGDFLLRKTGLRRPPLRKYFYRLDDKYWDTQFLGDYTREPSDSGESAAAHEGRYITRCLHDFPWAHFSYI